MGAKATSSGAVTDETVAIRHNIARTRAEMAETIEQLGTRLDPEVLKEQAKAKALEFKDQAKAKALELTDEFKETAKAKAHELTEEAKTAAYDATIGKAKIMVQRTSNGIIDTVKENPIPLALVGLGLGWLIVNRRAPQAKARVALAIGDKTDVLKHQATDLAHTAQSRVMNAAQSAQTAVRDAANEAQVRVRDAAHEVQMRGRQVETMVEQKFNTNPLAIGLGVAAAGLLIGLAIPTTRKENEILGATRDRLLHQGIGKVDELAHKALDTTKEQLTSGGDNHQDEQAQPESSLQPTLPQT